MSLLKSEGFEIIEGAFDFKYKTRIFIRHPDGRLNPFYNTLNEVPILPNGTEFDLDKVAMPVDNISQQPTAVKNTQVLNNTEYGLDAQGLVFPVIIGYIVLSIILLAMIICLYYILHPPAQQPPCGTEGSTTSVSECLKIIVMPNCDSRAYNACEDEWAEDDWHFWEEIDWGKYLLYGALGVGAIVVVLALVKSGGKEKYYSENPGSRPAPKQGYLSRKWYGD